MLKYNCAGGTLRIACPRARRSAGASEQATPQSTGAYTTSDINIERAPSGAQ